MCKQCIIPFEKYARKRHLKVALSIKAHTRCIKGHHIHKCSRANIIELLRLYSKCRCGLFAVCESFECKIMAFI